MPKQIVGCWQIWHKPVMGISYIGQIWCAKFWCSKFNSTFNSGLHQVISTLAFHIETKLIILYVCTSWLFICHAIYARNCTYSWPVVCNTRPVCSCSQHTGLERKVKINVRSYRVKEKAEGDKRCPIFDSAKPKGSSADFLL